MHLTVYRAQGLWTQRSKKRVVRAELSVKRLVSNLLSARFAHAK